MTLSAISKGILTETKGGGPCSGTTSNRTLFTIRPVSSNLCLAYLFSKVIYHVPAIVRHTHMIHSSGQFLHKAFSMSSVEMPSATNLTDNGFCYLFAAILFSS